MSLFVRYIHLYFFQFIYKCSFIHNHKKALKHISYMEGMQPLLANAQQQSELMLTQAPITQ